MSSARPGAVFDCQVFVQALANVRGPAAACKQLLDEGRLTLFVSTPILAEIADVLSRPSLRRRFKNLTLKRAEAFLRDMQSKAVLLADVPATVSLERDPKDEPYLNLAVASRADYLVSRDRDLLDLMNQESFRQQFPFLTILDPVEFLREMALGQSPDPTPPDG